MNQTHVYTIEEGEVDDKKRSEEDTVRGLPQVVQDALRQQVANNPPTAFQEVLRLRL